MTRTISVLAALALVLTASVALSADINVPADYATIQGAVDAAIAGDTIIVAAGTYEEQVCVAKDLTITGAGVGVTTIASPDALVEFFTTSGDNYAIVYIHDTAYVTLENLTVDGLGKGNANYRFVGVGFWNAGGSMSELDILNVIDTPFSGAQHGVGVYSYNDTGGPYSIDMIDVHVEDFQKTAVALAGSGLVVDLENVSTVGAGPTTITAQNGIQVSYGPTGTLNNCYVEGVCYTGASWTASGYLMYGGDADITNSVVTGSETSVYYIDGSGCFNNSQILNPLGDAMYAYSTGARAMSHPRVNASPMDPGLYVPGDRTPIVFEMVGSTVTGADVVDSWGPCAYGVGPVDFVVDNCDIGGWDWAVVAYAAGSPVTGHAYNNCLDDNLTYGIYSTTTEPFDAIDNWFGDASGPGEVGPGTGTGVSDNVVYEPWLTNDPCGGSPVEETSWGHIKSMFR